MFGPSRRLPPLRPAKADPPDPGLPYPLPHHPSGFRPGPRPLIRPADQTFVATDPVAIPHPFQSLPVSISLRPV